MAAPAKPRATARGRSCQARPWPRAPETARDRNSEGEQGELGERGEATRHFRVNYLVGAVVSTMTSHSLRLE